MSTPLDVTFERSWPEVETAVMTAVLVMVLHNLGRDQRDDAGSGKEHTS